MTPPARNRPALALLLAALLSTLAAAQATRPAEPAGEIAALLQRGELKACEERLKAALAAREKDDHARFQLGIVQTLRAVETLAQDLNRHGLRPNSSLQVLSMLGVPRIRGLSEDPPPPEEISYDELREIVRRFLAGLETAEKTLAHVEAADIKVSLPFGLIRADLNGDGKVVEREEFWRVYAAHAGLGVNADTQAAAEGFRITFDRADVDWLRAYLHLLSAIGEAFLAHDTHELFERCGHLVFQKPKTPYPFLDSPVRGDDWGIVDLIAAIHLINFPVVQPDRMRAALDHLEKTIALSRTMWDRIQAETDDEAEWIPSPRQTGVIPGVRMTDEMVRTWPTFLDEAADLLAGRKLVPFWRGEGQGVNLRMVFLEPRSFDLVMWLQGTGAAPYLEQGEHSKQETWDRLQGTFEGRFLTFAVWIN